MGIFTRDKESRATAPQQHADTHERATTRFNSRPSFGQWLKVTWLDIITMALMGALGLGIYEASPCLMD